ASHTLIASTPPHSCRLVRENTHRTRRRSVGVSFSPFRSPPLSSGCVCVCVSVSLLVCVCVCVCHSWKLSSVRPGKYLDERQPPNTRCFFSKFAELLPELANLSVVKSSEN